MRLILTFFLAVVGTVEYAQTDAGNSIAEVSSAKKEVSKVDIKPNTQDNDPISL